MALGGRERFMRHAAGATSPHDEVRRYVLSTNEDRATGEVLQILASLLRQGLHPDPDYRLPVPTLLLHGADDRIGDIATGTRDWAARDPMAVHAVLPDAGHASNQDNPEAFTAALSAFLEAVVPAGAARPGLGSDASPEAIPAPGLVPIADASSDPRPDARAGLGADPGPDGSAELGAELRPDASADPSAELGADQGPYPSAVPGLDPSIDPGREPRPPAQVDRAAGGRRAFVRSVAERLRSTLIRRGRMPGLRTAKVTLAVVAAYLLALVLGLSEHPVVAPLVALLVVQLTLYRSLVHGLGRVVGVVAGVGVAVLVAQFAGLTWWSLGAVVAGSIVVGKVLRLGPHLFEAPISAMLLLEVGGGGALGLSRVEEAVVGALVGIAVSLLVAPPLYLQPAGAAIGELAERMAGFARGFATGLQGPWSRGAADRWMAEARAVGGEVARGSGRSPAPRRAHGSTRGAAVAATPIHGCGRR